MERGAARALLAVLAVALLVRGVLFFGGVRGSDAYLYAEFAHRIAIGAYDPVTDTMGLGRPDTATVHPERVWHIAPATAAMRYAVLLPTALVYRLVGVSDASSSSAPLAASLATVVIVSLVAGDVGGAWVGVIAAALLAVYPLDVRSASLLGPDSFLPALTGGAYALLALLALPALAAARVRLAWLAALGAGALVGVATMARETSMVVLIALAALLLLRRARRLAIPLAVGAVVPLALEALYLYAATGDALYRVRTGALLSRLIGEQGGFGVTDPWLYAKAMAGASLEGLATFGLLFYATAVGVVLGWRRFGAAVAPLVIWLAVVLGYLSVGTVSLTRYVAVMKTTAYASLLTVPAIVLAALALGALWPERRRWLAAAMVLIACTSLAGAWKLRERMRDDDRPYEIVAAAVAGHPERPIYVHHERWALFLNYFLRYETGYRFMAPSEDARLRDVARVRDVREIRDAYVVAHVRYLAYDFQRRWIGHRADLPRFLASPPPAWQVVVADHGRPAYNDVVLYYAPPLTAVR